MTWTLCLFGVLCAALQILIPRPSQHVIDQPSRAFDSTIRWSSVRNSRKFWDRKRTTRLLSSNGRRYEINFNRFFYKFLPPPRLEEIDAKKIANEVEIVQTLSRLNRTAPGKDGTFVIDFVNDPDSVRLAFAKYDSGAQIIDVQDLNVVYEIKAPLDKAGIYDEKDLDAFREARFKAASRGERVHLGQAT